MEFVHVIIIIVILYIIIEIVYIESKHKTSKLMYKGCKIIIGGHLKYTTSTSGTGGSSGSPGGTIHHNPETNITVKLRKEMSETMLINKTTIGAKITMKIKRTLKNTEFLPIGDEQINKEYVIEGNKEFVSSLLTQRVKQELFTRNLEEVTLKGKKLNIKLSFFMKGEWFKNKQVKRAAAMIDRLIELGYGI